MATMVTKQKIFDQLYLFWDIQGWTYTSQKFHVPRSKELRNNWEVGLTPPPPPSLGIRCGSKTLGIRRVKEWRKYASLIVEKIDVLAWKIHRSFIEWNLVLTKQLHIHWKLDYLHWFWNSDKFKYIYFKNIINFQVY